MPAVLVVTDVLGSPSSVMTSRRRMMPPTPQQSSHSSIEEMQWQAEMEAQGSSWSARERTVTARVENYLNKCDDMKLEIEALEQLQMDSDDSEVCLRYMSVASQKSK